MCALALSKPVVKTKNFHQERHDHGRSSENVITVSILKLKMIRIKSGKSYIIIDCTHTIEKKSVSTALVADTKEEYESEISSTDVSQAGNGLIRRYLL